MKNIIITTTNSIEKTTIERYIDIISTNVVIGTNVFSDFAASFTDFFGGTSETYQKKLDSIYKEAVHILSQKATTLGANAIIGLRIDFNEISGKGKSMFMISATGTAVKISHDEIIAIQGGNKKDGFIPMDDLQDEVKKIKLIQKLQNGDKPSESEWDFLHSNFIPEVVEILLVPFLQLTKDDTVMYAHNDLFNKIFPLYFSLMDNDKATELLYPHLQKYPNRVIILARKAHLFNPAIIKKEIKSGNFEIAIQLLNIDKKSYSQNDMIEMKSILSMFDQLPDIGKIEVIKGVFSKGEEKYICANGHKNPKDIEFCQEYGCYQNIKGLTYEQISQVDIFKIKVKSLEILLASTD